MYCMSELITQTVTTLNSSEAREARVALYSAHVGTPSSQSAHVLLHHAPLAGDAPSLIETCVS